MIHQMCGTTILFKFHFIISELSVNMMHTNVAMNREAAVEVIIYVSPN